MTRHDSTLSVGIPERGAAARTGRSTSRAAVSGAELEGERCKL